MDKIGKYQVIRTLGKGATATVYLCEDPTDGKQVAVKLIRFERDGALMSRRMRKLFQNEGMVAKRLNHPNIVQVYDTVVEEDQAYLAMEYVEGYSLEDFISSDRLLPMHRAVSIIFKCCMALDSAYRKGIIHRDIKPANIMVTADDEPKIADFGLALNLSKDLEHDTTFIMGVGSPAYMSPEQIKGYPLNQKTDLYSLGVVLFQLLTGRLPFQANNQATLIYRVINTDPPDVTAVNPNLPASLNPILKRALEKDLYHRYRNGAEFAQALSGVRYQLLDEDTTERDSRYFDQLRKLPLFTELDNESLWSLLRVSVWRELPAGTVLIKEGERNRLFGIIVSGDVEVAQEGKRLAVLGTGQVVGEVAFLHPRDDLRTASVTTMTQTRFLDINAASLALSSEDLLLQVREVLLTQLIERFRAANQVLAAQAPLATTQGTRTMPSGAGGRGATLTLAP